MTAPTLSLSKIDRSIWVQWAELEADGNPGFFLSLIELYLQSTPVIMASLQSAIDQRDHKKVAHCAHSLKSSCRQMGALALGDALEYLESLGRPEPDGLVGGSIDHTEAVACVTAVATAISEVAQELEAETVRLRTHSQIANSAKMDGKREKS